MDIHFGFSYIGAIFLFMLFIPNLFWTKHKPNDYERYIRNEKRLLRAFERAGEVLVTCFALIFSDFNISTVSKRTVFLIIAFIFMLLYEYWWLRYFKSEKSMKDFYTGLLGIPVAGATLPVMAFLLLGIYGKNLFMIAADIILGIGHIGIHLNHRKEIERA